MFVVLIVVADGSECACKYKQISPRKGGCIITKAAKKNEACRCTFIQVNDDKFCVGENVKCKQPRSDYCKNPDKSKYSCEQGEGNCNGYN